MVQDYEVKGQRSLSDMKRRIELHIAPVFGERRAADITASDIRSHTAQRRKAGAKPASINRELAIIERAFRLAIDDGMPMFRPKIQMQSERGNERKGFFDDEQFQAILKHPDDDLKPLSRFAFVTGWRIRSEVFPLEWSQVNFVESVVTIGAGKTKGGDSRVFPFTEELRAVLEEQRARRDELKKRGIISPYVFNRNGKRIRSVKGGWNRARIAAGLPWAIPHDFRRSCVRNLRRAGISDKIATQLVGHKTLSVYRRYDIIDDRDLRDAARLLDDAQHSKTAGFEG